MTRQWRFLAALVAFFLVAASLSPGQAYGRAAMERLRPIRIGVMAALSGVGAASGTDMINGWKLYWQQHGASIDGHPVQMFYEDDAGDPNTALTKARLLVTGHHVDMLVGNLFASTGLAVAEYVKGTGTPYFIPVASADNLTQRERIPNVVRIAGWSSSQTTHVLGLWAAQQHYKTVVTIAQDYAFGWESTGGFVQTFTQHGGKVIEQMWHPIGTADFGSYMARIQSDHPDLVFTEETGADSVRLVSQWNSFGLKNTIPLVGQEPLLDQSLLRTMSPAAALGLISAGHYCDGRNNKDTQAFVRLYEKAQGQIPSYYAAAMYTAAEWLATAMTQLHGNVTNGPLFLKTVKGITLPHTPFGPEKLDQYGNPVLNVYIRKVEKGAGGKLWNVPIKTYPQVSQFYPYNPATYLKQPVYSRSFQGIGQHP
jgi:branched-chain amino acid transport system substrate-binding protein